MAYLCHLFFVFFVDDWAQRTIEPGLVIGHEFVGRVEELGDGVYPGAVVEGDEYPSQHDQDPGVQLPVRHGHAVPGTVARQPNHVLGADVRGEQRCADDEPPDVPPGEEVVGRRLLPP